jgi:hypothetical protein
MRGLAVAACAIALGWACAWGAPAQPAGQDPGAADAPAPSREPVVKQLQVLTRPTSADISHAYPEAANRAAIGGHATVVCEVAFTHLLENCKVTEEEPKGYGFGEAVLSLTPKFRAAPATVDGTPVAGSRLSIPVGFRMMAQAAPRPKPPPNTVPFAPLKTETVKVLEPPPVRALGALWTPIIFAFVVLVFLVASFFAPGASRSGRSSRHA